MVLDEDQRLRGGQASGERFLSARGLRTRAALVVAAKAIFQGIPFAQTRIADITTHARVSTGTFYTYFDSKEEIFREVADDVLAELLDAGRLDPGNTDRDPIGEIAAATRRFYHALLRNAWVARSIEQLAVSDEHINRVLQNTVIEGVKQIHTWIRHLQARDLGNIAGDPWTTAMVLHTMSLRVAYDHLLASGNEHEIDRLVDAVTHVSARAVGLDHSPWSGSPPTK